MTIKKAHTEPTDEEKVTAVIALMTEDELEDGRTDAKLAGIPFKLSAKDVQMIFLYNSINYGRPSRKDDHSHMLLHGVIMKCNDFLLKGSTESIIDLLPKIYEGFRLHPEQLLLTNYRAVVAGHIVMSKTMMKKEILAKVAENNKGTGARVKPKSSLRKPLSLRASFLKLVREIPR